MRKCGSHMSSHMICQPHMMAGFSRLSPSDSCSLREMGKTGDSLGNNGVIHPLRILPSAKVRCS